MNFNWIFDTYTTIFDNRCFIDLLNILLDQLMYKQIFL